MKTLLIGLGLLVSFSSFSSAEIFIAKKYDLRLYIHSGYDLEHNAMLFVSATMEDGYEISKGRYANCRNKTDGLMICENNDPAIFTTRHLEHAPKSFEVMSPFTGILTFANGETLEVMKE